MAPGFRELLACPACRGPLAEDWSCGECGARFEASDGIPNLRLAADGRTEAVRRFYEQAPFPGYPPGETLEALRLRAERSEFVRLLDRAIPGDARVADVGCGTGQMSLVLARADRLVIGADLTRASLLLGAKAASCFGLAGVHFVETDLRSSGLKPGSFDVVYSSGVVHHTPNPRASFRRVAELVRLGGIVVLGVYNSFARIPTRVRRLIGRLSGFRRIPFDAVLPARHGGRREAWLRDQYQHPEEHSQTLRDVQHWFAENRIDFLRSYPSTVLGEEVEDLFSRAPDDWRVEAWFAQVGWMRTLGREGGLFFTIGRRMLDSRNRPQPAAHLRRFQLCV
jgi:SAM-dependent methyltransferase